MDTSALQYDVIVVGGGPGGIGAAVAAARQGAHTALLERGGVVGGMLTAGQVQPILGSVAPGSFYDMSFESATVWGWLKRIMFWIQRCSCVAPFRKRTGAAPIIG